MAVNSFFDETTDQSVVKTEIVQKYFWTWAKVIIPTAKKHSRRIAYIDLFAGPGRYRDGTRSTPLLILERALQDSDMREMLVTIFNDRDARNSNSLAEAIQKLTGIERLRHQPRVGSFVVGEKITKLFEGMKLVPTLSFVDPWGYKGLSLRLVNSVLKDWGCDCIFFFNYNRISMGLSNSAVKKHMDALFGQERAKQLRKVLQALGPRERELAIIEKLTEALAELGGKYVLPFCFKNNSGRRTSHHLILVSKNAKGYEIMKDIMARESSSSQQGVPSFEYNPADQNYPMLFELSRPLDDLEEMLLEKFAGQRLKTLDIYKRHNVGTPYVTGNYKQTLKKMEETGRIKADPPRESRRRGTFADSVVVTFPSRRS